MFQLIITIFSVALAIALAGTVMWFGGDIFSETADKSEYSEALNGGAQIESALNLYLATHSIYPTGTSEDILDTLVDEGYLSRVPDGDWTIGDNFLVRPLRDGDQCEAINRIAGLDTSEVGDGCPACDDQDYEDWPACEES